ncbi:MAG: hypothetical protein RBT49_15065 [Bacteroidales bacterium]|jgi:hypothetical protein|nr:hypothetical protein [Bacteroidales bacterium]
MGLVREPKGVDFVIQSPALTEKDKKEIGEFIESRKRISTRASIVKKTHKQTEKTV